MSWQPDIDELNRRTAMSHQMGGADSIAFHKGRGKLTVRERIDILADQGSFRSCRATRAASMMFTSCSTS